MFDNWWVTGQVAFESKYISGIVWAGTGSCKHVFDIGCQWSTFKQHFSLNPPHHHHHYHPHHHHPSLLYTIIVYWTAQWDQVKKNVSENNKQMIHSWKRRDQYGDREWRQTLYCYGSAKVIGRINSFFSLWERALGCTGWRHSLVGFDPMSAEAYCMTMCIRLEDAS